MTHHAYYNEHDAYAAQWLRNLIAAGHIAPGFVDERSIEDVKPDDLREFTQCHFFAGIGVWSYALRRAGWPDDRPVWTGSCPCQPFSTAGAGAGFDDKRHLWPHFAWLIWQRQPTEIFGEQVASKDAGPWLDVVQTDLEALGYAFGAVPFPAASVGAPHIRDRMFWVGNAERDRSHRAQGVAAEPRGYGADRGLLVGGGGHSSGGLGDASSARPQERQRVAGVSQQAARPEPWQAAERTDFRRPVGVADTDASSARPQERQRLHDQKHHVEPRGGASGGEPTAGPVNGFWADADWIFCRDGKWRPVEPGAFPLADGAASRVGRLRAYGNAINAYQASEFIGAYLET